MQTFPVDKVVGDFIKNAYLFFERRHFRTVDGFVVDSLITGELLQRMQIKMHNASLLSMIL